MKTTMRWLREFVDLPTEDPGELASVLDNLGFAVEEVRRIDAPFSGVVVGSVTVIRPHPDADSIRLATVDTGDRQVEVVCGAWNFDVGATIAFSPPGATLRDPDGNPFEVGERAIRGVVSPGMICSLRELGLGDDHTGILVLADGTPLGTDFASLLPYPDVMFDLEITPNRPDAMCTEGIARELAAHYQVPLRTPEVEITESGPPATVTVDLQDPDGCPRFTAREVRGVTVGPAPLWMRIRLEACGVRSLSNVVDVSNYVMLELGHPNHVFDRHRLGDRIVVRRAGDGERLETLDGVTRELTAADLVIADATKPVGLAGVMGGGDSEVSAATTDVVIEAAYFDPPTVLLTAKRHGLHTEASARFQRGMDPNNAERANRRVAQLLAEHAGGVAAPGAVDAYPAHIPPWQVELPLAEVERVTGRRFTSDEVTSILERLGFECQGADPLAVTVPTRRPDVCEPVDLIEDIARLWGYDNFGDEVSLGYGGGLPAREQRLRKVRAVMVGAGYSEAQTFAFVGQADLDGLGLPADDRRRQGIAVVNPLREEEGVMRTTLLPGLLKAAANNLNRRVPDVALFEAGKVFIPAPDQAVDPDLPAQPDALAWVLAGPQGASWDGAAREPDVFDATGVWQRLAASLELGGAELRQASPPAMHPERSAEVTWEGSVFGVVGELHPNVAAAFGLEGRVAVGEIDLERVLATPPFWTFETPSSYPPVIFDLAFDCAAELPAAALVATVRRVAGPLLERLDVFDVFTGDQLGEGRKSIAVRLGFRAPDRTLTDEEMAPIRRAIAAAVEDEVGGMLRGEA